MLKPAENKLGFAKVGLYGGAGSGKTHTAAKLAIGIADYFDDPRPIAMFDTEPGASFIIPMFQEAGRELLVFDESRSLVDLMKFMEEAEQVASVIIVDSVTHVWRDSMESFILRMNEIRKGRNQRPLYSLEFHHWNQIKPQWHKFTDKYLGCKTHAIVCGRAGAVYSYQKNEETGRMEVIQEGTRMATEKELGYEPSLLIEMRAERIEIGKNRIKNVALVEKDRADKLNGQEFEFPSFKDFVPHFDTYNRTGNHAAIDPARNSSELYEESAESSGWDGEKRQRKILSEEIIEEVKKIYPSQSSDDKQQRLELFEEVFGTRSWTKISEDTKSERLKLGLEEIRMKLNPPEEPEGDVPY